jgi:hypothetical protein
VHRRLDIHTDKIAEKDNETTNALHKHPLPVSVTGPNLDRATYNLRIFAGNWFQTCEAWKRYAEVPRGTSGIALGSIRAGSHCTAVRKAPLRWTPPGSSRWKSRENTWTSNGTPALAPRTVLKPSWLPLLIRTSAFRNAPNLDPKIDKALQGRGSQSRSDERGRSPKTLSQLWNKRVKY